MRSILDVFSRAMDSANLHSDYPIAEEPLVAIDRRRFLKTAAFAGFAVMFGATSDANAFWFGNMRSTKLDLMDELKIPIEWSEQLGATLPDYVYFLHRLRLKNISVKSVIEPHLKQRGRVTNSLPPKDRWKNMAPTLRVVDRVASILQEPSPDVVSAYRSPAYNRSCGSSGSSQHIRNTALDLKFESSPRTVAKVARELRDKGLFLGGVGRYSGFTHVDTRGVKADW